MGLLFILIIIFIALLLIYDYKIRSTRVWRYLSKFPGEPALPLIGTSLQIGTSSEAIQRNLKKSWEKHGKKNFRVVFGTSPMLMLCETADVKKILSSTVDIQKSEQQRHFFLEAFGQSLTQTSGHRWKLMRRLLTPVFHYGILEKYLNIANSEGIILMDKLKGHVDGPPFNIYPYILAYSLDVISGSTMGLKVNAQSGGSTAYIKASRRILPNLMKRWFSFLYQNEFIYMMSSLSRETTNNVKTLYATLDEIIESRRKNFEKYVVPQIDSEENLVEYITNNKRTLTFIDILLLTKTPDGQPLPLSCIKEETNLIMFAGFDTTLSGISFSISNLAKYKHCQDSVFEEQMKIFGEDSREPTMNDLNEMKYLRRFIMETMRITPPVAQYSRQLENDVVIDDGKIIPAGANLTIYLPGLHMNPENFPDPETFNPDRFLGSVQTYTYLPFSAGSRNCIGMNYAWMEMRSALSKFVRRYEVFREGPHDDPIPVNEFVNISKNGFRVQLKERKRR